MVDSNRDREIHIRKIGLLNTLAILILGSSGQIAWVVENSWFNTFVFDEITKDPQLIAWMVAISAITATVTTIIMGIISDRTRSKMGRRKPFIVFGYIAWGIVTAIYPTMSLILNIGIAVVMVVVVDAIMTFFGSTANDAAFNAWITDIGHSSNRNRIQMLNSLTGFIAAAVALGAAGFIIDSFGYFIFFYLLGGIVTVSGILSIFLVKNPSKDDPPEKPEGSFISEFKKLVNPSIFKENTTLFLLFVNMAISGIAAQVYLPYLYVFLENYLGLSKTLISIYLGIFLLITVVILVSIGLISHKFNRKTLVLIGTVTGGILMVLVGIFAPVLMLNPNFTTLLITLYFLGTFPGLAATVAHGGWLQDKYPGGDIGKFQGMRMIFMVLLPMVIGPPIGSAVIQAFGIPTADGFIPTPEIFLVGGLISLLAVIPILFIPKAEGRITFEKKIDDELLVEKN